MGHTTVEEEKNILFQGIDVQDDQLRNSSFIICPTSERKLGIFEIFSDIQPSVDSGCIESDLLEEMTSTFVDSSLYVIGGRVPNGFKLSDSIRWLNIQNSSTQWEIGRLPFPCADPVIGVYEYYLCILPGVWKHGCDNMDEDTYLTDQKGCIWDTSKNKCLETEIGPPEVDGEKGQWHRIRACAALDGEGLLIAMDGEKKKNFFLYKPEKNEWKNCNVKDPLPKFIGETSFAASNGRLYILEVRGKSPAFLYIYDIKAWKLVMYKEPILEFDDDLWSMDKWDRVVRIVPVADDKLCFLWLGPVSYENEKMWPPVRILHYLKVKFSVNPSPCNSDVEDSEVEVEDSEVEVEVADRFRTCITNLLDCLPCDPQQFRAEVEGRSPLYDLLNAFQKQQEDNASAEEIGTSAAFQRQREEYVSPEAISARTQLEDSLSSPEQKRAKGTGNASVSSQKHVSINANSNSTPKLTAPARQRSMKRNNSGLSQPPPPGSAVEAPLNSPSSRDHARSGFISQSHSGNDHPQHRNSFRNRKGGPHPRGDGSHTQNYGGRRNQDHGNQDWNHHRNFNCRDAPMPSQRGVPRLIRHALPPPNPAPYMPPSPSWPFGTTIGFHEFTSVYNVPAPTHPDPLKGVSFVTPKPPVFFPPPDLQLHDRIVNQIDYYFSNENLMKDTFLRQNMDDHGWVPIKLIAGFKKVLHLTDNIQFILDAMRSSMVVEVQGDKVRKRDDWKRWIMPRFGEKSSQDMLAAGIQNMSLDQNVSNWSGSRNRAESSSGDLNDQLPSSSEDMAVSAQGGPVRISS